MSEIDDSIVKKAKLLADATGRSFEDVLEDLLDDGKLNNSNTVPAEAAEAEAEAAAEEPAVEASAEEPAEEVPSDWSNGEDPWAE